MCKDGYLAGGLEIFVKLHERPAATLNENDVSKRLPTGLYAIADHEGDLKSFPYDSQEIFSTARYQSVGIFPNGRRGFLQTCLPGIVGRDLMAVCQLLEEPRRAHCNRSAMYERVVTRLHKGRELCAGYSR